MVDSDAVQIRTPRSELRTATRSRRYRLSSAAWTLTLILALALPAHADAGVPMLFVTWPAMLLALIPIVLIEAWILKPRLRLGTRKSLWLASLANLASTIVGIPVAWVLLVMLEMAATNGGTAMGLSTPWQKFLAVTIQAPWLIPYESDLHWMVPAATLALLPAYFVASWLIEYGVILALLRRRAASAPEDQSPETPARAVLHAAFSANLTSYAILAVITLVWLGVSIARAKP